MPPRGITFDVVSKDANNVQGISSQRPGTWKVRRTTAPLDIELPYSDLPLPRSLPIQFRVQVAKSKWRHSCLCPPPSFLLHVISKAVIQLRLTFLVVTLIISQNAFILYLFFSHRQFKTAASRPRHLRLHRTPVPLARRRCTTQTIRTIARPATHTTSTGQIMKACA